MFCYDGRMLRAEQKSNSPTMATKLQVVFEMLGEVQEKLTEAFALQGAAAPATYKAIDKAWEAVQTAAEHIDGVRYK